MPIAFRESSAQVIITAGDDCEMHMHYQELALGFWCKCWHISMQCGCAIWRHATTNETKRTAAPCEEKRSSIPSSDCSTAWQPFFVYGNVRATPLRLYGNFSYGVIYRSVLFISPWSTIFGTLRMKVVQCHFAALGLGDRKSVGNEKARTRRTHTFTRRVKKTKGSHDDFLLHCRTHMNGTSFCLE